MEFKSGAAAGLWANVPDGAVPGTNPGLRGHVLDARPGRTGHGRSLAPHEEERSSRRRSGGGPLKTKFSLPGIKKLLLPRPTDTASLGTSAVPARALFG